MARSGLSKAEVKNARNALLAQNRNPSVDAVRIALGNTGSKTTIHRYLKELDAEEVGVDRRLPSVSEALQTLVEQLAQQLQCEADVRINAIQAQQAELKKQHSEALAETQKEIARCRDQISQLELKFQDESRKHAETTYALRQKTIALAAASEQVEGIRARLAENEAHRISLEEKHRHAYESLEHYRQLAKDQREQDTRRHERQVQELQAELRTTQQAVIVKQDELTRLNHESASLAANLMQTRATLHDAQEQVRVQSSNIVKLEQRNGALAAQIERQDAQTQSLQKQLSYAQESIRRLEIENAEMQVKVSTRQEIAEELYARLFSIEQSNATQETDLEENIVKLRPKHEP